MSQYPEYRSSSMGLVPKIPSHWVENTIKRGFEISLGKMLQGERKLDSDLLAPYLRSANVQWGSVDVSDVQEMWFSSDEATQLSLEPGDLVACEGGDAGRAAIWQGEISGCYFQNSVNRVRSHGGHSTNFLMYWLSALKAGGLVDIICNKATIAHLTKEKLANLPMVYPPIDEQIAIAAYLDAETKRIDELIAGKENLLELVEEIRLSTIYDVITKGLNSGIEMVETGVSWIGQAPIHWTVKSIKRLSTVKRGASPRPIDDDRYFDDAGEYGWVRIEDVSRSDGVLTETTQKLSSLGASLSVKLEPGKLFLSIAGTVGKPCISGSHVCIHDGFVYFPDLAINSRFLFRLFESKLPFRGLGKMGTQLNLNTQTVGDIKIALPPANEIEEIVDFLESKIGEFNKLRKHVEHELEMLKELRVATITDAVLGRIDVSKSQTQKK